MNRRYKATIQIDYDNEIASNPDSAWIKSVLYRSGYKLTVYDIDDTALEPVWISADGDKHYPSEMSTPHIARALRCCHGNGGEDHRARWGTPIYNALINELIERNV